MDSVGQRLERLARLRTSGDLSDAEHELLKARLIAGDEGVHLEYECQVWMQNVGYGLGPLVNLEASLESKLNAGVAKGWKLFSVTPNSCAVANGIHVVMTLVWEVPSRTPDEPQGASGEADLRTGAKGRLKT